MERSHHFSRSGVVGQLAFAVASFTLLLTMGFHACCGANQRQGEAQGRNFRSAGLSVVLRNAHFEGQVKLEATVLPNGTVSKVEVKGGNPMLATICPASGDEMEIRARPSPDRSKKSFSALTPILPIRNSVADRRRLCGRRFLPSSTVPCDLEFLPSRSSATCVRQGIPMTPTT